MALTNTALICTVRALNRHRIFFFFLLFASLLVSFDAFAKRQVLRQGREKDILALFAPYTLGSKVNAAWSLWSVSIEHRSVKVHLRDNRGAEENFSLLHPEDAPDKSDQSKSFALGRSSAKDPLFQQASTSLFANVIKNDDGGFWEKPKLEGKLGPDLSPKETAEVRLRSPAIIAVDFFSDGIVTILIIWTFGILLAVRLLREAPKWIRIALPLTIIAGIAVRLMLSPPAFLGAWPWSRLWSNIQTVFDGPVFEQWVNRSGQTFFLTDVMMWTNFVYAAAMPLILFSHATYLLRDPRVGIGAAFMLAFLPQHIRFSLCEDAFVPSLVLTSLAFALIHAWLRDPSKTVRILALVAMPIILYRGYLLRPLNILFVAIYCVAMLLLHPETAPKQRRAIGLVVVIGVWLFALPKFLSSNEAALANAPLDMSLLGRAITVILTPKLLVLTDIDVTPLVLLVLAGAGAFFAWRSGEKRTVLFLGGWLLMFVGAHAVVVEPPMQPRYHMHLVVPFLLLAANSVPRLWQKARFGLLFAGAILVASPWLHRHWIRDLHYAEMHEYAFVREARDIIPAGCTVIEYVGSDKLAKELRFARIGDFRSFDSREFRYRVIPAFASGTIGESGDSLENVLENLPECSYLYQGLECANESAIAECAALKQRFVADSVKETEIPREFYNSKMGIDVPTTTARLSLKLFRLKSVNH